MLSASEPCCFVAFVTSSWLTHCFFVSLPVFDLLLFYWTTTVQQLTIGTTTVTRPFLPFMWFLHIRLHTEISPVSFSPLPGIYRFSYLIPLHMLLATRRHTYLFFFLYKKKANRINHVVVFTWPQATIWAVAALGRARVCFSFISRIWATWAVPIFSNFPPRHVSSEAWGWDRMSVGEGDEYNKSIQSTSADNFIHFEVQ